MTEPTSGLGTDPAKWAVAFLDVVGAPSVGARSKADRLALVADWFAAAMDAAIEEFVRRDKPAV
jgi:hypothetical protein